MGYVKVSDFDFDKKTLFISHGKGGKQRWVSVAEPALVDIKAYIDAAELGPEDSVFGKSTQSKRKTFKRIQARIWFTKFFSPQVARKSLATNMWINGCDIESIRNQMGHSSVVVTMVYIKFTPKIHKAKYDAYCPLYKNSQRTAEALIIRQITRDPLNVVASYAPRPAELPQPPVTGVIDIAAVLPLTVDDANKLMLPANEGAALAARSASPTDTAPPATAPVQTDPRQVEGKWPARSKAGKKPKPPKVKNTAAALAALEGQPAESRPPRVHTFQISLFDKDQEKVVLMTDEIDAADVRPSADIGKAPIKIRLPRVNQRQRVALIRMHETCSPMTNAIYRSLTQVTRNIAHDDLVELCERKILQCEGAGRGVRYWLSEHRELKPVVTAQI